MDEAPLAGRVATDERAQSGIALISEGLEAFALRMKSAGRAQRRIDVQTYIWHIDTTGACLIRELLVAADRGVQVRLLVDSLDARHKIDVFAALAAHPRIAVKLFNPAFMRSGLVARMRARFGFFQRMNRRMHNKSWIVDDEMALVGGRNLGDEYFGASNEINFVDMELALTGAVVHDIAASFERYWNAAASHSMLELAARAVSDAALANLRLRLEDAFQHALASPYAQTLKSSTRARSGNDSEEHSDDLSQDLAACATDMLAATDCRFVADNPDKALTPRGGASQSAVLAALLPIIRSARKSLAIISPYFVPGRRGTAALIETARAGCRVRVLTNSLAANDVAIVHGGYVKYRRRLIHHAVGLWELKPLSNTVRATGLGSSAASLHTKALTADEEITFVGSYNLDPRSTSLNCEQGVLVRNALLARRVQAIFDVQCSASRAWTVTLERGLLRWSDDTQTHHSEPLASLRQRFLAGLARWFPIDPLL